MPLSMLCPTTVLPPPERSHTRLARTVGAAALIWLSAGVAFPQASSRPQGALNDVEVLLLVGCGEPGSHVATLLSERGIIFEPAEQYVEILQAGGADQALIQALVAARRVKPSTPNDSPRAEETTAIEHQYREALQQHPGNAALHFVLGSVRDAQGSRDEAIAQYREA